MTKTYRLVNPYVIGSMNTNFQAKSSLEAAKLAYDNLSQYFGNHMPTFQFSLKRMSKDNKLVAGSSKSFVHFQANEIKGKDDTVKYEITEIEPNMKTIKNFQSRLNKVANQDEKENEGIDGGGYLHKKKHHRHHDDEDDDDELSDYFDYDLEKPRKGPLVYEPIVYYWYDPFVYPLNDRFYVPTFVLPLQPRVVIDSHSLLYHGFF
jgi:hypothetical protein